MRSRVEHECIRLLEILDHMKAYGCKCQVDVLGRWNECSLHENYREAVQLVSEIETKSLNEGWTTDASN